MSKLSPKEKAQELILKIQTRFDNVDFSKTKADINTALDFCFMILTMNKKLWIGSKSNGGFVNSIDIHYWNNVVYELEKLKEQK